MKQLKIVFMGTPDFACGILTSLIEAGHDIIGVVSQPDRKVGRKQVIKSTPVKTLALQNNITVLQPEKISKDYQAIMDLKPDLIVTCAYGQMIPQELLDFPAYGSLNVHASLLPKLRGGAPIHKAIIYGYSQTGVSIMRMVKKMDAGDYMLQGKVDITMEDTAGSLHDKLMACGSKLIIEAIELLVDGQAQFIAQDEQEATFAYNISKEEEKIDLTQNRLQVYNQIRGLIPWPVGYIIIDGLKMKLHGVKWCDITSSSIEPGKLFYHDKRVFLSCIDGVLEITKIQKEGKKISDAASFIAGNSRCLIEGEI